MNKACRFLSLALIGATIAAASLLAGCKTSDGPDRPTKPNRIDQAIYDLRTNFSAVVRNEKTSIVESNVVSVPETNDAGQVSSREIVTFKTNVVVITTTNQVPSSIEYIPKATVEAGLSAGGSVVGGLFGAGGLVSTALVGLYHAYASMRSRKVNKGLAQIIETGREILSTTPQGQQLDRRYVEWMHQHQQAAGYVRLAGRLAGAVDNDAAQAAARLITDRPTANAT